MQIISGTPCRRHEASFALHARTTPCKYKHEERDREYADIGRERHVGDISGGDIAPGLPAAHRSRDRWIIDRRLARNQRVGASPHYATLDTCEYMRASHVQNGLDTRGIWARVRCNKGDNGHYYRRVTFLGTYQSPREIGTRPISISEIANLDRRGLRHACRKRKEYCTNIVLDIFFF